MPATPRAYELGDDHFPIVGEGATISEGDALETAQGEVSPVVTTGMFGGFALEDAKRANGEPPVRVKVRERGRVRLPMPDANETHVGMMVFATSPTAFTANASAASAVAVGKLLRLDGSGFGIVAFDVYSLTNIKPNA